jgi:hypothetical protein
MIAFDEKIRLDWSVFDKVKHASLSHVSYWLKEMPPWPSKIFKNVRDEHTSLLPQGGHRVYKKLLSEVFGANVIKLFTAVIYNFS